MPLYLNTYVMGLSMQGSTLDSAFNFISSIYTLLVRKFNLDRPYTHGWKYSLILDRPCTREWSVILILDRPYTHSWSDS